MIAGTRITKLALAAVLPIVFLCVPYGSFAQSGRGVLDQLSESLRVLSDQVSPAVVEIRASKYGKADEDDSTASMLVKQRITGSGVILSPDGYIVTNAHVIEDAKHIRVFVHGARMNGSRARSLATLPGAGLDAAVVGLDEDIDIAVLKIKGNGLPTIPLADYEDLRQGQMVIAIGSPLGAHNAVTIGVVSSVARQIEADSAAVYIQTDAALNPGNSGGPLVDTSGKLVGINTMIMDGDRVGLAIPSDVVKYAYEQIRSRGQVTPGDIGLDIQEITPALAAGLGLSRDSGVIVADVHQGGSAEKQGVRPEDVLVGINGEPVQTFAEFVSRIYRSRPGDSMRLELLRGAKDFRVVIPVTERKAQAISKSPTAGSERGAVPGLGVYAVDVNEETADSILGLRMASGALVTKKSMTEEGGDSYSELDVGDVIHRLNGVAINRVEDLRTAVAKLHPGDAVVLQVERKRRFMFISFDLER